MAALTTALFLGSALAGCGGNSSSALPTTNPIPASSIDKAPETYSIDRNATAAWHVTSAGAYKLPLQGEPRAAVPDQARGVTPESTRRGLLHNYGGPTIKSAKMWNIYVNNTASYWGDPGAFLNNWNAGGSTTFEHLLDQYTATTTNNRYSYGGGIQVSYNTSGQLSDQDMYNIIHPVAQAHGTGYTNVYHVYFMQGVAQCSSTAGGCYAVSGGYCAYHSSVNFTDIGHTIYSFEGYQNISGCSSPSGKVADSTDSTMSHEMYEAITDPDVNNGTLGWYSSTQGEIGDICRSSYGNIALNGTTYDIQKEYSNKYASCSFSP